MSEQFGIQELSDERICKDEIKLYKNSMLNKKDIITAAAIKLEKSEKYKTHEIANRIVKLFTDWKKSTIYNVLDSKYTREYKTEPQNKQDKMSLFEEVFVHLIDSCDNLKKFATAVIKRANESEQSRIALEATLTESIHNMHDDDLIESLKLELSKIRQLTDLVEFIKFISFESQLLSDKTDSRQKIDMALKIGLKLKLVQHLPRELATKLKISPKWLSQIDNDNSVIELLDKIPHCPKCDFDFSDYINKCKLAESKNLPIPQIS